MTDWDDMGCDNDGDHAARSAATSIAVSILAGVAFAALFLYTIAGNF